MPHTYSPYRSLSLFLWRSLLAPGSACSPGKGYEICSALKLGYIPKKRQVLWMQYLHLFSNSSASYQPPIAGKPKRLENSHPYCSVSASQPFKYTPGTWLSQDSWYIHHMQKNQKTTWMKLETAVPVSGLTRPHCFPGNILNGFFGYFFPLHWKETEQITPELNRIHVLISTICSRHYSSPSKPASSYWFLHLPFVSADQH